MEIKIYQINMERDTDRVAFESLENLQAFHGSAQVDSSIYDKVYEGNVDCSGLEDVFQMFNLDHPEGYRGRSLSVSDVVEVVDAPKLVGVIETEFRKERFTDFTAYTAAQEALRDQDTEFEAHDYFGLNVPSIEPGFYFCDSIGFKKIEFEAEAARQPPEETIKVVLLEPGKLARITEIGRSLEQMQAVVGGDIEAFYPFEEEVCIVCNEEGKINGMALNRAIREEETQVDMSYGELVAQFREAERRGDGKHVSGFVVITEDSFNESYPEESRTYEISSNNKAFQPGMGGYSIYASAIDGSDPMVRLERYLAAEKGGVDGWKIERCYMKEPGRKILDIIAGPCFICDCSGESFGSLSDEQAKRYQEKYRLPEDFARIGGEIVAIPYKPKNKDQER